MRKYVNHRFRFLRNPRTSIRMKVWVIFGSQLCQRNPNVQPSRSRLSPNWALLVILIELHSLFDKLKIVRGINISVAKPSTHLTFIKLKYRSSSSVSVSLFTFRKEMCPYGVDEGHLFRSTSVVISLNALLLDEPNTHQRNSKIRSAKNR